MDSKVKKKVKQQAKRWFLMFDRVTREASMDNPLTSEEFFSAEKELSQMKVVCPFLINRSCSIYSVRPVACRTYVVDDSPSVCEQNPVRNTLPKAHEIYKEAYDKLHNLVTHTQMRPLVYAVSEALGLKIKFKPLLMSAYVNNDAEYKLPALGGMVES
ncbi:MAG TPA: YkgJ family cysteine cluster protein [Gammaproteobacteria bacterium]|jgi:Fe-S-cluster containining protein|uniref:Zinc/iron-chelating domain-containing protein n=1 Tax=Ketobacter alkanivorans TaxID=1917421 RepID=A0A2K9LF97_9GAMM|nr:hypothetical protein Kalk_00605 [Ketobacter alkanivorans]MAR91057.1 hypothetical protein [Pseudomonadales bacterium]HAG92596.1 YkgJ family cysteine cluster protein [Gammaproteobacteria bacterium]HAU15990.1 YkgJ family cysteine cluster protein [Gammaproteobacteria bacterium]|tara:strand:- start:415 stop:888 length:474 start_codon:yes stop_codon:yes gene_type:complete